MSKILQSNICGSPFQKWLVQLRTLKSIAQVGKGITVKGSFNWPKMMALFISDIRIAL